MAIVHVRKAPAADWVDSLNATSGLAAAADTLAVLTRDRGRVDAVFRVTGRDVDEQELALRWDPLLCDWGYSGDPEAFRQSRERAEIERVVAGAGRPIGPAEVAARIDGSSAGSVRHLMARMVADGRLAKAGRGLYTAVHIVHTVHNGPGEPPSDPAAFEGSGRGPTGERRAIVNGHVNEEAGCERRAPAGPFASVNDVNGVNGVNDVNGERTEPPPAGRGSPWRCACSSLERRYRPEHGDWVCDGCGLIAPAPVGGPGG